MPEATEQGTRWWIRYVIVPLAVAIIGGGGLISIAVAVIPYVMATPAPTQIVQITASPVSVKATDAPTVTIPTAIILPPPTAEIIFTPTLAPVIVDKGENQAGNTSHKRFDINLSSGEAVVGQSWELIVIDSSGQKIYAPCVAYLFEGSGQYSFSIIAGYWYRYQNVTPSISESLLQGMVDSLVSQKCPSDVKVVHVP